MNLSCNSSFYLEIIDMYSQITILNIEGVGSGEFNHTRKKRERIYNV